MRRVTGIGGIFLSARDPKALCDWYKEHLGIDVQPWGGAAFDWTDSEGNPTKGTTAWSIGPADGKHFAPSKVLPVRGTDRPGRRSLGRVAFGVSSVEGRSTPGLNGDPEGLLVPIP